MESTKETVKVTEIIEDAKVGMFATIGESGRIESRPLVAQQVLNDGDLWFVTDENSPQVAEVERTPAVTVTFSGKDAWVSLFGHAEVVRDAAKSHEVWSPLLEAWYPKGPDTPGVVLITVHAESAEYWEGQGKVATALQFAKAKVTGLRSDAGGSHSTKL